MGTEWRKIIFDDYGRPTPKSGEFVKEDELFIYLKTDRGVEAISKSKIVRMEISGGDGNGKY